MSVMSNSTDAPSKLKLRLAGVAGVLIPVGALSYWYSLCYIPGKGGKIITVQSDPLEFYSSIIPALGILLPKNKYVPAIPPQKVKGPAVNRGKLIARLRSVGTKRVLSFLILVPILLILARSYDIHWIIAVAALVIITSFFDHLIFSKMFRCPSCNGGLWNYTTRRLKVRKLTLLPGLSGCPHCGVSFE